MIFRWVRADAAPVPATRVVAFDDLDAALPPSTPRVTDDADTPRPYAGVGAAPGRDVQPALPPLTTTGRHSRRPTRHDNEGGSMDLGFAGARAAVTGGTKGMGRAIADRLAGEGAQVAVLARRQADVGRDGRRPARRRRTRRHGLGHVDVTDRSSVTAAFAAIGARWDSLNVLVNTVGPGAGQLRGPGRRRLGRRLRARPDVGGALHPGRPAAAAGGRVGPHRQHLGPLHPAPEPLARGLHGIEGGAGQRVEEPGQVAGPRGHPGQHGESRAPSSPPASARACGRCSRPRTSTRPTRSTS